MGKQPEPWRDLFTEFAKLKRMLADLARRSPFYNTGMKPDGKGGIQSNDFDGDLIEGNAGTRGWAMNAVRAAFGEILLRPGSIGNDSLTSPVTAQYIYDTVSNFALSTTIAHVRRYSVTVPPGFTSAIVSVTGRIYAINSTAGLDYLYTQTNVSGYNGLALPLPVSASGGSGFNVSPFAVLLSGLTPGSTFFIDVDGQTAFGAWAANASNMADLAGSIIWFR